ncbi:hypothetical protein E2C01_026121 [Portunus trituberculatus]|uniref:Uncharacterized protein n=1 Tax=Portunus trituberculatus TaxID=210409 RepID=A0A5B7EEW8_PORTR|nr:hypothetical protein [Portunus trituberculatus]
MKQARRQDTAEYAHQVMPGENSRNDKNVIAGVIRARRRRRLGGGMCCGTTDGVLLAWEYEYRDRLEERQSCDARCCRGDVTRIQQDSSESAALSHILQDFVRFGQC